jgi:hypothetical protein
VAADSIALAVLHKATSLSSSASASASAQRHRSIVLQRHAFHSLAELALAWRPQRSQAACCLSLRRLAQRGLQSWMRAAERQSREREGAADSQHAAKRQLSLFRAWLGHHRGRVALASSLAAARRLSLACRSRAALARMWASALSALAARAAADLWFRRYCCCAYVLFCGPTCTLLRVRNLQCCPPHCHTPHSSSSASSSAFFLLLLLLPLLQFRPGRVEAVDILPVLRTRQRRPRLPKGALSGWSQLVQAPGGFGRAPEAALGVGRVQGYPGPHL